MAAAAAEIAQFIKTQREVHADSAEEYARMEELYTRKLWHQLTLAIAAFVAQPRLRGTDGDELSQLYEHFIRHFESKMNALALAKLVIEISRYFPSERATHFVTSLIAKVASDAEAVTLCKTEVAQLKLKTGDTAACKALLDEAQVTIDTMAGIDVDIHISFYTTLAHYYKVRLRPRALARHARHARRLADAPVLRRARAARAAARSGGPVLQVRAAVAVVPAAREDGRVGRGHALV
jgi:26S proteasome regulatory subunit N9